MDTLDLVTEKRNVYRTILHSDQGFQSTSHANHKYLAHLGVIDSHSRKGNCQDNACIESFFSDGSIAFFSRLLDRGKSKCG
ncbi:hypothetical protein ACFCVU_28245 [Peribacillus butanolivorans]|uniref:hypothetical protein n=1 Tax=Peribacillus butanolivorans TaxID=421767 RepID=UPI0035E3A7FF